MRFMHASSQRVYISNDAVSVSLTADLIKTSEEFAYFKYRRFRAQILRYKCRSRRWQINAG
ncbi:hypothetical protein GCM10010520_22160 [Rhizobium viscosum]